VTPSAIDAMPWPVPPTETRSREDLRRHYEIEKSLSDRLRRATTQERRTLYGEVYDELFRRVDLPTLDPESRRQVAALEGRALEPLLTPDCVFLEIGAGDGALALEVAARVRRVVAVEASAARVPRDRPANFELVLSGSLELPLGDAGVDVAYSCHFLEHLHPDDAPVHAAQVRRVLRPGGRYLCVTPNRLWGPHDVSRSFDDAPAGLHLREYTHGELARLLRRAGFRRAAALRLGGTPRPVSVAPYAALEGVLGLLSPGWRRRLLPLVLRGGREPFRPLEQVKVVATA